MPAFVEPELAAPAAKPPSGEGWIHEIKFDGYRLQVRLENGRAALLTRSGLDWTEKFGQQIVDAFAALSAKSAILDGEIVARAKTAPPTFRPSRTISAKGVTIGSSFTPLICFISTDTACSKPGSPAARSCCFVCWQTLTEGPLQRAFCREGCLGADHARQLGLEGIISKLADSEYVPGRTGEWVNQNACRGRNWLSAAMCRRPR